MNFLRIKPTAPGFTLIEVMIALAIISVALTSLYVVIARSIRAGRHAQRVSQATLLCRYKMAELEAQFQSRSFADGGLEEEVEGTFLDSAQGEDNPLLQDQALRDSYQPFRFRYKVEKIKLPNLDGLVQTMGIGADAGSTAMSGQNGMLFTQVKTMIEDRIRKLTLQVIWDEPEKKNQQIEVVMFFTDASSPTIIPGMMGGGTTTSPQPSTGGSS